MANIVFRISKSLETLFKAALYVNFKVDLILLEFFGRIYTYPFFLFAFLFGHFDSSSSLSDPLILFRFFCFCVSTYLIGTSILVYIAFNVKISKEYLYRLLGEEFVKSKIGNPGKTTLLKYLTPLATCYGFEIGGKHLNEIDKRENAQQTYCTTMSTVETSKDLTSNDRRGMTKQALKDFRKDMNQKVDGPVTQHLKIEAVKNAWNRTLSLFSSKK